MDVHVVGVVNGPNVPSLWTALGHGWTRCVGSMGGGEHHRCVSREEIGARGPSQSIAHLVRPPVAIGTSLRVQGHDPNAVASDSRSRLGGLIDKLVSSKCPIGFGIVASIGELTQVGQMRFPFVFQGVGVRVCGILRGRNVGATALALGQKDGRSQEGDKGSATGHFHATKVKEVMWVDVVFLSNG